MYVQAVSEKVAFTGEVIRTEPGGFGVIRFDNPVGPSANNYGIVSTSTGTSTTTTITFPDLKPGVKVFGIAEADERQLATVTNVTINTEK